MMTHDEVSQYIKDEQDNVQDDTPHEIVFDIGQRIMIEDQIKYDTQYKCGG